MWLGLSLWFVTWHYFITAALLVAYARRVCGARGPVRWLRRLYMAGLGGCEGRGGGRRMPRLPGEQGSRRVRPPEWAGLLWQTAGVVGWTRPNSLRCKRRHAPIPARSAPGARRRRPQAPQRVVAAGRAGGAAGRGGPGRPDGPHLAAAACQQAGAPRPLPQNRKRCWLARCTLSPLHPPHPPGPPSRATARPCPPLAPDPQGAAFQLSWFLTNYNYTRYFVEWVCEASKGEDQTHYDPWGGRPALCRCACPSAVGSPTATKILPPLVKSMASSPSPPPRAQALPQCVLQTVYIGRQITARSPATRRRSA
jgi:hypothetical protein